eukprot:CAMPEP_0175822168 /NCGR_PEP_ID=MMETSP0107_2-20121207/9532_1 /TAXON_ID=195067 ORGANISM="Goniomonas pacifica, Strain CCMP1869" /NCGR_SAMPLE_ID=MMETSP0107_2 /ASSEMBLY_ACC=CAM_ASM_000203 /LENGTH=110 /DNA_ID=CAMNT_0017134611 /DNA_START=194 /DNA_END=526 /DNA_ORIENTATION=+
MVRNGRQDCLECFRTSVSEHAMLEKTGYVNCCRQGVAINDVIDEGLSSCDPEQHPMRAQSIHHSQRSLAQTTDNGKVARDSRTNADAVFSNRDTLWLRRVSAQESAGSGQ